MTEETLEQAAKAWLAARRGGEAEGITAFCPGAGLAEAYAFQARTLRTALAGRGASAGRAAPAGWKIAFTADAMRTKMGLAEPAYGYMLAEDLHPSGFAMTEAEFSGAALEPEIAFRLERDVGAGESPAALLAAAEVCPAFELVRGRVRSRSFCLPDMVADDACFGGAVLAGGWVPAESLDLAAVTVAVSEGETEVARGAGAGVMGSPVRAVAWLARRLGEAGGGLLAGQVVISGSLTAQIPAKPGKTYTARFSGLGEASVSMG